MKTTITTVTFENGIYTATYSTGNQRTYTAEKLPKTVRAWMDEHEAPETVEAPEAVEAVELEVVETTEADMVEAVELTLIPAQAAEVETVSREAATALPHPIGQWPLTWFMFRALDVLTDIYFWMTTYIPIGARWLVFHLVWDVLPALRTASREAVRVSARMAVVAGRVAVASVRMAVVVAGILQGIGAGIVEGWRFRADLIQETKVA